ncbi:sugar diacid utilization regulator [Leucobacter exalbidus]|uniref:Sugar diacid utilization regulator n=1 Tax=Leucobacter exalbidus TaxID=662960 RepID=A0A940PX12_9MICO|nr:helix-turn-helix domain-containing protein [Leucobacter exalbidus]MBP1326691.1 sugar diacid utilization regulator [Leucobacter exalbidus]
MEGPQRLVSLPALALAIGSPARMVATEADLDVITVRTAALWHKGTVSLGRDTLIVVPATIDRVAVRALRTQLHASPTHAWAFCGWSEEALVELQLESSSHAAMQLARIEDAAEVFTALSQLSLSPSVNELRRLTALQRSFSQALEHEDAIDELLRRLQKVSNAACLVVDHLGRVRESAGSLPLSLFLEQIRKTEAATQHVSVEGWQGQAIRLKSADASQQEKTDWLIVAARRREFPTSQDSAAAHIVASLIEAARRIQLSTKKQENAIRASIFDEVLALTPKPDSPELASRMSALGIDFNAPLRLVVASVGLQQITTSRSSAQQLWQALKNALLASDTPFLSTEREATAVYLIQASVDTITRIQRINKSALGTLLFGVGREINTIGDIPSAHADALIAIRTIQSGRHDDSSMSYEQFDFATRVFASVGLEQMAHTSRSFLEPLLQREPMLQALRRYFEHDQNTNATADSLGIHHNTLRYRLAKVEELLDLKLNDPAAIASLFLATTALDLVDLQTTPAHGEHDNRGTLGADEGASKVGVPSASTRHASSRVTSVTQPPKSMRY